MANKRDIFEAVTLHLMGIIHMYVQFPKLLS